MKDKIIKGILKNQELSLISDHIFENILIIGDPHIYNARPGRRRDDNFLTTILDKMNQAKDIANNNNAYVLITGDFFHTKTIEIKSEFLNKIIKIMKGFKFKPLVLSGNHEKSEWAITDKDALSILKNTDLVDVIDGNELFGKIRIKKGNIIKEIALGGTCFGESIPYDLTDFLEMEGGKTFREDEEVKIYKEEEEKQKGNKIILINRTPKSNSNVELHEKIKERLQVDKVIWMTHHDLVFGENYPYARPLHPIDGVDLVINGHMHNYKKPVKKDLTQFYNPGNIVRLKIDEIDNIPSVWLYNPIDNEYEEDIIGNKVEKLNQVVLKYKHAEEVFNFEGKNITSSQKDMVIDSSNFIKLMLNESIQDKTDEAVFIKEVLDNEKENLSTPAYNYILNLLSEVVEMNIKK